MTPDELTGLVSALFVILCGLVVYVWQDSKRSTEKKIDTTQEKIDALDQRIQDAFPDVTIEKVRQLELRYESMHTWKNTILPQQLERMNENLYGVIGTLKADINSRLDKHEQKIERLINHHIEDRDK